MPSYNYYKSGFGEGKSTLSFADPTYGSLGSMGMAPTTTGSTVGAGASTPAQVAEANRLRYTKAQGYAGAGATFAAGTAKAMDYASQYFQTKQQRDTLGLNIRLASQQIGDIVDAGEYQKAQIIEAAQRIAGAQRAATAGSGMVVDQGSAARVMAESSLKAAQDVAMTDANMRSQAAAQTIEIGSMRAQSAALKRLGKAAKGASIGTLVSSSISAAGQAYGAYNA